MTDKVRTTIYLPKEVLRDAQELGLNVSKTCEIALKQAIRRLKPLYAKNNPEDNLDTPLHNGVGAAAGIRTRVVGSGSRSPNQVFQLAHFALISRLRPPQTS